MLTNENMTTATISNSLGSSMAMLNGQEFVHFAYLPLAHMCVITSVLTRRAFTDMSWRHRAQGQGHCFSLASERAVTTQRTPS